MLGIFVLLALGGVYSSALVDLGVGLQFAQRRLARSHMEYYCIMCYFTSAVSDI